MYRLLFGSYPEDPSHVRKRRSLEKLRQNIAQLHNNLQTSSFTSEHLLNFNDLMSTVMSEVIPDFKDGLLHQLMNQSALWGDKRLVQFVVHFLTQTNTPDLPQSLTPDEIAEIVKVCYLFFWFVSLKIRIKYWKVTCYPKLVHDSYCNSIELTLYHKELTSYDPFNPFPKKPWFLRVCSTGLLKTLQEKEKLLVTSNFFFFHSVFYSFGKFSAIFTKLKIVV